MSEISTLFNKPRGTAKPTAELKLCLYHDIELPAKPEIGVRNLSHFLLARRGVQVEIVDTSRYLYPGTDLALKPRTA